MVKKLLPRKYLFLSQNVLSVLFTNQQSPGLSERVYMYENIKFMRIEDISKMLSISAPTIRRLVAANNFPKPYKIGLRANGWLLSDIEEEITRRHAFTLALKYLLASIP